MFTRLFTRLFTQKVLNWFNQVNACQISPITQETLFGITASSHDTTIIQKFNYTALIIRRYIYSAKLKAYFQPWCNARCDLISCNTKFPDHWKPSKIVFLRSHPGLIVNCFAVVTFAVRHFTVSLQHFEFCPEESEENFFQVSRLDLFVLCEQSWRKAQRSFFFYFLEVLGDSKWR